MYCHHTWSHQNLDNATLYDAQVQIQLNKRIAAAVSGAMGAVLVQRTAGCWCLLRLRPAFWVSTWCRCLCIAAPSLNSPSNPPKPPQDYLNIAALPTFSSRCMVTPQISGLRNGDALAALAEAGVTCATGDNTWPFLLKQDNPYHPLYTTAATNGYDGLAIIPRFATEVYYNCRWGFGGAGGLVRPASCSQASCHVCLVCMPRGCLLPANLRTLQSLKHPPKCSNPIACLPSQHGDPER